MCSSRKNHEYSPISSWTTSQFRSADIGEGDLLLWWWSSFGLSTDHNSVTRHDLETQITNWISQTTKSEWFFFFFRFEMKETERNETHESWTWKRENITNLLVAAAALKFRFLPNFSRCVNNRNTEGRCFVCLLPQLSMLLVLLFAATSCLKNWFPNQPQTPSNSAALRRFLVLFTNKNWIEVKQKHLSYQQFVWLNRTELTRRLTDRCKGFFLDGVSEWLPACCCSHQQTTSHRKF